jgi:hypothetical protein
VAAVNAVAARRRPQTIDREPYAFQGDEEERLDREPYQPELEAGVADENAVPTAAVATELAVSDPERG